MAKKSLNFLSEATQSLKEMQQEIAKTMELYQQLYGSMGQFQQAQGGGGMPASVGMSAQGGGAAPFGGPGGPNLSAVPDQTAHTMPDPTTLPESNNGELPTLESMFPTLTPQQRVASELGVPLQGMSTHSDLSQSRIAQLSLGSESRQNRIAGISENLLEGGSSIDIETANRLRETNTEWSQLSQRVSELHNSMTGLSETSAEYQNALKELMATTVKEKTARERLTQLSDEASEILRQRGGDGGGGGDGPFWMSERNQALAQGARVVGQGMQTAGSMYGAYGQVYQAGMQQDLASELRILQATGRISGIQTDRYFGAMDLTRGSNAVRYFGDYLSGDPDAYSYLGTGGGPSGRELAEQLTEREYRFAEQGLGFSSVSAGLRGAGTALTLPGSLLGGAAMGAGVGSAIAGIGAIPGALIGGGLGLFSGLNSLTGQAAGFGSQYATNAYALSQGGLAGTGVGALMYGDQSSGMASRAFGEYWMNRNLTTEQYREQLRDAEMMSRQAREAERGYDEMRAAIEARKSAVPMLGRFATDALPRLNQQQRLAQTQVRDYQQGLTDDAERQGRDQRQSAFNEFYRSNGASPTGEFGDINEDTLSRTALTGDNIANIIGQIQRMSNPDEQLSALGRVRAFYSDPQLAAESNITSSLGGFRIPFLSDRPQRSNVSTGEALERFQRLEDNLVGARFSPMASAGQRSFRAQQELDEEISTPFTRRADNLGAMQLTFAEWAQKQNLATSMIFDGRASGGLTSELIRMGRAGLGSDQELAGNVMSLQSVSGRQNDLTELKDIMTEAVSVGFNKSAMAQRFVQATTQLAGSLRTTATGEIAQDLAFGARVFGSGGEASLLSLEESQRSISQLGAFTGQAGGIVGSMKSFSAFEGGMSLGGGAGLALDMNIYQLQEASQAALTGEYNDPRTERLIRSMARSRFGVNNLKDLTQEQRQELSQSIRGVGASTMAPTVAAINAQIGSADGFQSLIEEGRKAAESGDMETYRSVLAEVQSYGAQTTAGEGATGAYFMEQTGSGELNPASLENLRRQIREGNAAFADPAQQARKSFINRLTGEMAQDYTGAARSSMVKRYFEQGGGSLSTRTMEDGEMRFDEVQNYEQYQQLPANVRSQITNAELMRGVQSKIAAVESGQEQGIDYISNRALNDLAKMFMEVLAADKQAGGGLMDGFKKVFN